MAVARSVLPAAIAWALGSSSSRITRIGSIRPWQIRRRRSLLASPRWSPSPRRSNNRACSPSSLFVKCSSSSCSSGRETGISALVMVEETLDTSPELEAVAKQLEEDAVRVVKLAVKGHEAAELAEVTELSLTLCGDKYIRKLNKEWLGKDRATDVLSFPQNQPPGESPLLLLGDVVISVHTAAEQANERDHSLLDEMRILLVHGLLHLLGYDHELGAEESRKMQKQEEALISALGWKIEGLLSASQSDGDTTPSSATVPRKSKSPYKLLFCDMDGTVLNSKSRITRKTADALRAAMDAGVQVVIATGKTRYASISALQLVGLAGENGVVSPASPGVFLQGLLVYGPGGSVVHQAVLPEDYCLKAFSYAVEHRIPVVGFTGDQTVAPFDDPFLRCLHEQYFEPKASSSLKLNWLSAFWPCLSAGLVGVLQALVLNSLDEMASYKIQKLLFGLEQEKIDKILKPQLQALSVDGQVTMTQAQRDMLEILPGGSSKGKGVHKLLEHLGLEPDEAMAIGDGENDVEMLEMVGWGVAMANGARKTLETADTVVASNDHDGVAEAVERFILP